MKIRTASGIIMVREKILPRAPTGIESAMMALRAGI